MIPSMVNITITIFHKTWGAQANMAHRLCINCYMCWRNYIVYLLHVIYALSLPHSVNVRACLCQQNWILYELLSPNISKAVNVYLQLKWNIIAIKALKRTLSYNYLNKKAYRTLSQRECKHKRHVFWSLFRFQSHHGKMTS